MMKKYLILLFYIVFSATSHAENLDQVFPEPGVKTGPGWTEHGGLIRTIHGVAVPSDFPEIEVRQYGATAPGNIFFISTFCNLGNYLIILNNDDTPYFYQRLARMCDAFN
ncbi:hypothetical protein JW835_05655 [bacterium]|nr:hypothetical protein [bacterium]